MYEYQVISFLQDKECQDALNRLAKEGWRLAAIGPNLVMKRGITVALARKAGE